MTDNRLSSFTRFAWCVTGYNILVILWGAWVRITGSGAGCGRDWPTCRGELVPRAATVETLIEYSHRLTSGLTLLFTVGLVIWAYRAFERGHRVRRFATGTLVFVLAEAGIGAMLVLRELVAQNSSTERAVVIALHLVNTLGLVGCGTLTAWWSQRDADQSKTQGVVPMGAFWVLLVGIVVTAGSGAVTALGDTLFPVAPGGNGFWAHAHAQLTSTEHFLIQLRIVHPMVAVIVAAGLFMLTSVVIRETNDVEMRQWAYVVGGLVGLQTILGIVNIALRAPSWLQLVHLLLANLVWAAFLILMVQNAHGQANATGSRTA